MKTFTLTDNSGWGQVSRPLLEAAKVIAPGTVEKLQMRFGDDFIQVRAGLVANFQGERLPTSLTEGRSQIRRLEHNQAFDPLSPEDPVRPANQRSAQALEQLKLRAATFTPKRPRRWPTNTWQWKLPRHCQMCAPKQNNGQSRSFSN